MAWRVGIDIGGTFTDLAALDADGGRKVVGKTLTTPDDPLRGVFDALEAARSSAGLGYDEIASIVHATTLATNLLIERRGGRVALLTTAGFRDVLETGHEDRYDAYDLNIDRQEPLVPRPLRLPVAERTSAAGEILAPVDASSLADAVAVLRESGVESVAVCLLHSYANGTNERRVAEEVERALPDAFVATSSDVVPIVREYERCVATAINAYVGPRTSGYLSEFEASLGRRGFSGELRIMKSNGGACSPGEAARHPVRILESGPAAGALAGARVALECGVETAVAFDMGGTTAKACLVRGGEPVTTDELEVARLDRLARGSGFPVRLPSVDLLEIGAGGGSIAHVDRLGLLKVGPESAGAVPGPACYGRGGSAPTVTDADLVLGYLNETSFAGGALALDRSAAERALEERLVGPARLADVVEAAWGVFEVANDAMALAIRLHCVEHGVDPAAATVVATGGAGPVHAARIAEKLGAHLAICPADPGVASAFGMLVAPRTLEETVTELVRLDELAEAEVPVRLSRLEERLRARLPAREPLQARRFVHMRLRGQAYEVKVPVPEPYSNAALLEAFERRYEERFARRASSGRPEIVNWTVELVGERAEAPSPPVAAARRAGALPTRRLYWGAQGWLEAAVASRGELREGEELPGPLVIEDPTSSIVVGPGHRARLDARGNVHVVTPGSRP